LAFWLEIASRPLLGGFRDMFPQITSSWMDLPCTETSFEL